MSYHPPEVKAFFANSSRSPGSVLKGGTSPVLSFQNSSRWYRPHWGVLLDLILGLFLSDILQLGDQLTWDWGKRGSIEI